MGKMIDEDDWGRVKMGRFSDADEKLVRRIMGNGFLKKGRSVGHSPRSPVSRKCNRSKMSVQVAANRVNCIVRGHSYVPTPQVMVKAVSTRKTIAASKCLVHYVARTRQSDKQDGLYSSITMHDALGRELSLDQILGTIDTWELMSNKDNLSLSAREKLVCGDHRAVKQMPDEKKYYYVQAHHFVLSINESGDNPAVTNRFHAAVKSTVRNMFAKHGYRCIWGLHDSHTEHLHAHLVVKAVSDFGKRLRSDKAGNFLDDFRLEFSSCLKLTGLNYEATRRVDRRATLERIMAGREPLRTDRYIWQTDVPKPLLGSDTINELGYLKQLKDDVRLATNGMGRKDKIVTATEIIREALDKPPSQSLLQRVKGKLHKNEIPPKYRPLAEALRPAFHDPAHAIAIWQNMAMNGAYRDAHGRVQRPNRTRANWELRHRPELFGKITGLAYELKDEAGPLKILKLAPLPAPEAMSEHHIDLELATQQRLERIKKDRRRAIASLKYLLNEVKNINAYGWWADVVRNAIHQAEKVEIGSSRVFDPQQLNDRSASPTSIRKKPQGNDNTSIQNELPKAPTAEQQNHQGSQLKPTKRPASRKPFVR